MCEMSLVKRVEEWLEEEEFTFASSENDEAETVFLVYINSINQSALLVEFTVNEEDGGELLCSVAPYIPKANIAAVQTEMKRLTFLNNPVAEFYFDDVMDSVMATASIDITDMRECFYKAMTKLTMFANAVDEAIPGIHYVVWNNTETAN